MDLVTINDGEQVSAEDQFDRREHVFIADGQGGNRDGTADVWPAAANVGADDNAVVVLDVDSDGDPDFLIASLSGTDRLLVNQGGRLEVNQEVFGGAATPGTLGIAVADLDGDQRLDVVQSQGELAEDERVYFGTGIQPDTGRAAHRSGRVARGRRRGVDPRPGARQQDPGGGARLLRGRAVPQDLR